MENLGKHKDDFMDGFKDGFLRSEAGKVCRWREHTDVNDGFKSINPVYTLAYECGYEYHKLGEPLLDETVEELFLKLVKHVFTKHHNDFNE